MTSNDELEALIKGLSKAITKQGKLIDKLALRIDALFEMKDIRENEQKPPESSEVVDDIPLNQYIRYKGDHYEFKAAPQIETNKAVQMLFSELGLTVWFPKSVLEDDTFQKGLIKWYSLYPDKSWILRKNSLIGEEEGA